MVTSAADFGDLQTKPNNAYLPLHIIPFWKSHTKDNAMKTSAADLGDLCSWSWWPLNVTSNGENQNNIYLPLNDIPFWKHQTKDIAMVTSAADLGDFQTK